MAIQSIQPGDRVLVDSLLGPLAKRATTAVVPGTTFPVIWVCREEEWDAAQTEGREPDAVPWPAEDVRRID